MKISDMSITAVPDPEDKKESLKMLKFAYWIIDIVTITAELYHWFDIKELQTIKKDLRSIIIKIEGLIQ